MREGLRWLCGTPILSQSSACFSQRLHQGVAIFGLKGVETDPLQRRNGAVQGRTQILQPVDQWRASAMSLRVSMGPDLTPTGVQITAGFVRVGAHSPNTKGRL